MRKKFRKRFSTLIHASTPPEPRASARANARPSARRGTGDHPVGTRAPRNRNHPVGTRAPRNRNHSSGWLAAGSEGSGHEAGRADDVPVGARIPSRRQENAAASRSGLRSGRTHSRRGSTARPASCGPPLRRQEASLVRKRNAPSVQRRNASWMRRRKPPHPCRADPLRPARYASTDQPTNPPNESAYQPPPPPMSSIFFRLFSAPAGVLSGSAKLTQCNEPSGWTAARTPVVVTQITPSDRMTGETSGVSAPRYRDQRSSGRSATTASARPVRRESC
ncbi:MAG: hypothetical protein FLDDKLPJ_03040 [Phycisphaerae bacterium]|nr:hypothetical protein [Phycisphaerae bacterium]